MLGKVKGHGGPKRENKLNVTQFLTWVIIGACVALLGVNVVHVLSCPDNNPDAIEAHYDAMQYRLAETEKHVKWQTSALNRIINHLQNQLTALDRDDLDALLMKSEEEAVRLALRLVELPAPPIPWDAKQMRYGSGSGETNSWSSYFTDDKAYGGGSSSSSNITDDVYKDDDWYGDFKKANSSVNSNGGGSAELFGGGTGARDDDDGFGKKKGASSGSGGSGGVGHLDDEYDDPSEGFGKNNGGSSAQGGGEGGEEVFRDNLSDADARHICEGWQSDYNVKMNVDWGSLPYDLQQKWLQYACDYLLKS
jgi:hypothetical protein